MRERRRVVEERLRALGRPRAAHRAPPPEGRLGAGEKFAARLRAALDDLGPVFAEFGRYLSSRVDLIPRRDCLEMAAAGERYEVRVPADAGALVRERLGDTGARGFLAFDPAPRAITRWTQEHDAWLASGDPVALTLVRPDADLLLDTDLPLLSLVSPWLDAPADDLAAAADDFSHTLRRRLDQTAQAAALTSLFEDGQSGGPLDAPRCYREYCAPGVLTIERVEGVTLADVVEAPHGDAAEIDREALAEQLATAWVRQAVTGHVVPFDFDLGDLRLRDDRLVLISGMLEPMTLAERTQFRSYLAAVAADDPEQAWNWIGDAVVPRAGQSPDALRRRLRQAVPFRDGEWSGDDRFGEQLMVQWRATRLAGWKLLPHHLHLYRGIEAVFVATMRLSDHQDVLRVALEDERLRAGLAETRHMLDSSAAAVEQLLPDLVNLPRRLDEILTMAADGHLRVKVQVPDPDDRREARNRTVSLVASLVALVGVTFFVRHVAPAWTAGVDALGALVVLILGGWLLAAAARL